MTRFSAIALALSCANLTLAPLAMSKLFHVSVARGPAWVIVSALPFNANDALVPAPRTGGVNGRQALVLHARLGRVPAGSGGAAGWTLSSAQPMT